MPTVLTIHENDYCVLSQLKLILLAPSQNVNAKLQLRYLKVFSFYHLYERMNKAITEN